MADYLITIDTDDGELVVDHVHDADSVKHAFELSAETFTDKMARVYRIADGPKFVSFEQVTETRMRVETS